MIILPLSFQHSNQKKTRKKIADVENLTCYQPAGPRVLRTEPCICGAKKNENAKLDSFMKNRIQIPTKAKCSGANFDATPLQEIQGFLVNARLQFGRTALRLNNRDQRHMCRLSALFENRLCPVQEYSSKKEMFVVSFAQGHD